MILYTAEVYNMRMWMKEDNPHLKNIKGNNSREMIIRAGWGILSNLIHSFMSYLLAGKMCPVQNQRNILRFTKFFWHHLPKHEKHTLYKEYGCISMFSGAFLVFPPWVEPCIRYQHWQTCRSCRSKRGKSTRDHSENLH